MLLAFRVRLTNLVAPVLSHANLSEFPRIPTGVMKRHIADEADFRLAYYLLPDPENPEQRKLPPGVVDTPLIRLYNFLRACMLPLQCLLAHHLQK